MLQVSLEDSRRILLSLESRFGRLLKNDSSLVFLGTVLLDYIDAIAACLLAAGHPPARVANDVHMARYCACQVAAGNTRRAHTFMLESIPQTDRRRWLSFACQVGQLTERDHGAVMLAEAQRRDLN